MVGVEKYSVQSLDESGGYEGILNSMLERKLHKRRNKPPVELCLTPSRVQVVKTEPWVS